MKLANPLYMQFVIGFLEDFFSCNWTTKTAHHFSIVFIAGKRESGSGFGRVDSNWDIWGAEIKLSIWKSIVDLLLKNLCVVFHEFSGI